MAVFTTAVSFLVGKLHEVLTEDIILLRGAREQMEWMETEFRRMECFLKDADGMEEGNETMKNWRQEVRDLSHEAEDAIDIFFRRVDDVRRAEGCWGHFKRFVFVFHEVAACREVASEVERMKERLRSISQGRGIYSIKFKGHVGAGEQLRLSAPLNNVHHESGDSDDLFVGLEKYFPNWVRELKAEGTAERELFCIVGMPGVGKSTFARKLYNDNTVKEHFPLRAWVSIKQQWSMKSISDSLAPQVRLNKDNMTEEEAKKKISKVLAPTRYLVVADDVWDLRAWKYLAELLPDSKNGSRIILTTLNLRVASAVKGTWGSDYVSAMS